MSKNLVAIPGQTIGILGGTGSGKSSFALELALTTAPILKSEFIVCNFTLDARQLARYCIATGNLYCYQLLQNNRFVCRSILDSDGKVAFKDFCQERNALFIIDEAGIFFNCRNWRSVDLNFLADLAQARKDRRRIFWIAQSIDQVDKQVRELTGGYILCAGFSRFSSKLQGPELMAKFNRLYLAKDFELIINKGRLQSSGFKAVLQSTLRAKYIWFKFIDGFDRQLFASYPSFERIGDKPALLNPLSRPVVKRVDWLCDLI